MTDRSIPGSSFYVRDVLDVAPDLPGKFLCRTLPDGSVSVNMITEVEAYRGEEDKACHASRGRTGRTDIMYQQGGKIYMYLIYGMYWMLNIVTATEGIPQAVLIRGIEGFDGPGKLTKHLGIDGSFYGKNIYVPEEIWIEDRGRKVRIGRSARIGIEYADPYWRDIEWRYYLK